jgi:hypothetical protein
VMLPPLESQLRCRRHAHQDDVSLGMAASHSDLARYACEARAGLHQRANQEFALRV